MNVNKTIFYLDTYKPPKRLFPIGVKPFLTIILILSGILSIVLYVLINSSL